MKWLLVKQFIHDSYTKTLQQWYDRYKDSLPKLTSSASRFPAPSIPVKVLVYMLHELAARNKQVSNACTAQSLLKNTLSQGKKECFMHCLLPVHIIWEELDPNNFTNVFVWLMLNRSNWILSKLSEHRILAMHKQHTINQKLLSYSSLQLCVKIRPITWAAIVGNLYQC